MVSEKKIFEYFSKNLPFIPNGTAEIANFHFSHSKSMETLSCPRQPIKLSDFDKRRIKHEGLLNKHFCKKNQISPMTQQKLPISDIPIISLWKLEVVIVTRVLIQLEHKT